MTSSTTSYYQHFNCSIISSSWRREIPYIPSHNYLYAYICNIGGAGIEVLPIRSGEVDDVDKD